MTWNTDWPNNGAYNTTDRRATAVMGDGSAVTVGVKSSFGGDMQGDNWNVGSYTYRNLRRSPHTVGGTNTRGLTMVQIRSGNTSAPTRAGNYQTLTIDFSVPVKNLKFTITDIDRLSNNHYDQVFVSPNATRVPGGVSVVEGSGTSNDPWRTSNTYDTNLNAQTGSAGNVSLDFGSTESMTYTVTFWNDNRNRGVQQIFINSLAFNVAKCA